MKFNISTAVMTRRNVLACLSSVVFSSATYASGGGGRDVEPSSQPISNDPPPAKKNKPGQKTNVMLTQKNYHRISTKGLQTAIKGIDAGHNYWIDGFTKKMSRNIFEMTLMERKRTLSIFKKMRTLTTHAQRRRYLLDREWDVDSEIDDLEDDMEAKVLEDILFDDDKEYVERLKKKVKRLKAYRKLLRRWIKKPMEGRLVSG